MQAFTDFFFGKKQDSDGSLEDIDALMAQEIAKIKKKKLVMKENKIEKVRVRSLVLEIEDQDSDSGESVKQIQQIYSKADEHKDQT